MISGFIFHAIIINLNLKGKYEKEKFHEKSK
jgi:hypothetical protein